MGLEREREREIEPGYAHRVLAITLDSSHLYTVFQSKSETSAETYRYLTKQYGSSAGRASEFNLKPLPKQGVYMSVEGVLGD